MKAEDLTHPDATNKQLISPPSPAGEGGEGGG